MAALVCLEIALSQGYLELRGILSGSKSYGRSNSSSASVRLETGSDTETDHILG